MAKDKIKLNNPFTGDERTFKIGDEVLYTPSNLRGVVTTEGIKLSDGSLHKDWQLQNHKYRKLI